MEKEQEVMNEVNNEFGLSDAETSYTRSMEPVTEDISSELVDGTSSDSAEEMPSSEGIEDEIESIEDAAGIYSEETTEEAPRTPTEEERMVDDNMKRRKRRRSRPSPFKIACGVIVVSIVLLVAMASGIFTIDSIEVEGNSYFTDEEIINMAHATTGKNLFFKSGRSEIIDYLENSPYIDDAKVSKKIPGTLVIKVKEREQVAAVVYGKEYLIIDENGLLLRRSDTEPKITILKGLKVSGIEVGENLSVENEEQFEQLLDIVRAMKEGDLYFTKVVLKTDKIRAFVYDSLVCQGSGEAIIDSIEKERLQKILETLFDRNIKRGTITISEDGYASFDPQI